MVKRGGGGIIHKFFYLIKEGDKTTLWTKSGFDSNFQKLDIVREKSLLSHFIIFLRSSPSSQGVEVLKEYPLRVPVPTLSFSLSNVVFSISLLHYKCRLHFKKQQFPSVFVKFESRNLDTQLALWPYVDLFRGRLIVAHRSDLRSAIGQLARLVDYEPTPEKINIPPLIMSR